MEIGQEVRLGGVTGVIYKIGQKTLRRRVDTFFNPFGEPFEDRDLFVKAPNPKGRIVKQIWLESKVELIK